MGLNINSRFAAVARIFSGPSRAVAALYPLFFYRSRCVGSAKIFTEFGAAPQQCMKRPKSRQSHPLERPKSPFHEACRAGDTERVRQLLEEGAPVDEKDEDGTTALMLASEYGHTEVVQLLLDAVVKLRLEKGASLLEKSRMSWLFGG